jgi:hypothetical protein
VVAKLSEETLDVPLVDGDGTLGDSKADDGP